LTVQPSGLARTKAAARAADIQMLSRRLDEREPRQRAADGGKARGERAAARSDVASNFAKQFAKAMDLGVKTRG
jgi:hypothetical protein